MAQLFLMQNVSCMVNSLKYTMMEQEYLPDFYSPVKVARYHSLAIIEKTLPDCLEIIAKTQDGEIMAVKHKDYPVVGLQFHPSQYIQSMARE